MDYVTYHVPLPYPLHGYIWPFVLAYLSLFLCWTWMYGLLYQMEGFFIGCACIGVLNVVVCLGCVWSVHVRCKLTCSKVRVTVFYNVSLLLRGLFSPPPLVVNKTVNKLVTETNLKCFHVRCKLTCSKVRVTVF